MIKALFFDLDGTLLTSSKKISATTLKALQQCKRQGIKVFVATARPPLLSQMLKLTSEENEILQDGGVYYNGGCICSSRYNSDSDAKILHYENCYTFLPEELVRTCMDVLNPYKEVNYAYQIKDEKQFFRYGLTDNEYEIWGIMNKSSLIDKEELNLNHVIKIVIFSPWSILPQLHVELSEILGAEAIIHYHGTGLFQSIDITNRNVSKKTEIDRIIAMHDFHPDEVAVFGDDLNDLEMLKGFKNSIAMGNASDTVKGHANYITLGNDEEGIEYGLKNILKLI